MARFLLVVQPCSDVRRPRSSIRAPVSDRFPEPAVSRICRRGEGRNGRGYLRKMIRKRNVAQTRFQPILQFPWMRELQIQGSRGPQPECRHRGMSNDAVYSFCSPFNSCCLLCRTGQNDPFCSSRALTVGCLIGFFAGSSREWRKLTPGLAVYRAFGGWSARSCGCYRPATRRYAYPRELLFR